MDKHYIWALSMTFVYSILGFINRNSTEENKEHLRSKIKWQNAFITAIFDAGFAILFFSAINYYKPEWNIVLQVGLAVFAAIFIVETVIDKIKDVIKTWKI